jgi:hypothetical protein
MSGDDDDETLIASKDWLPPELARLRPAAGAAPRGFAGAGTTHPMAPAVTPQAAAAAAPAPAGLEAAEGAFGTPPFVMSFLLVCGVLTALGLIALIYLEM